MGQNNEYNKNEDTTNDVELKGDVELDFGDELEEIKTEERESMGKTYDIGPTASKTLGKKSPPE